MQLLDDSLMEPVFAPLAGKLVGYVQGWYGNAGDGLIHAATLQLLETFGIRYEIVNPERQWAGAVPDGIEELVLFGGGNMGYPSSKSIRTVAQRIPLPKTLLPQSWRAQEAAPYDRIFIREPYSQSSCPAATLAPDLALCLKVTETIPSPSIETALFLRTDGESKFDRRGPDPAAGLGRLSHLAYIHKAATVQTIVTDRLHFAIAGLICQRRVVLLPNAYHKNRGVFEAWLEKLGCEWACDLEEAEKLCPTLKWSL